MGELYEAMRAVDKSLPALNAYRLGDGEIYYSAKQLKEIERIIEEELKTP